MNFEIISDGHQKKNQIKEEIDPNESFFDLDFSHNNEELNSDSFIDEIADISQEQFQLKYHLKELIIPLVRLEDLPPSQMTFSLTNKPILAKPNPRIIRKR